MEKHIRAAINRQYYVVFRRPDLPFVSEILIKKYIYVSDIRMEDFCDRKITGISKVWKGTEQERQADGFSDMHQQYCLSGSNVHTLYLVHCTTKGN